MPSLNDWILNNINENDDEETNKEKIIKYIEENLN